MKKNKNMLLLIIYSLLTYCIIASVLLIIYCNLSFKENEYIKMNDLYLKVNNSVFTSYNDQNELISKEQTFLILDIDTNIDYKDLYIKIDNRYYGNNNEYKDYFKDISENPQIYIINNQDLGKDIFLFYQYKSQILIRNYKVELKPVDLNKKNEIINYYLTDKIVINNVNTSIDNYEIKNNFIIPYNDKGKMINKVISEKDRDILRLHFTNIDNVIKIGDYMCIIYVINGVEYKDIPVLMNEIIENSLYFSINKNIKNASSIIINITSRNQNYNYFLK